jgi:hypothetical protein
LQELGLAVLKTRRGPDRPPPPPATRPPKAASEPTVNRGRSHALLAALWVAMMLLWMAGLGFGLWWIWPHVERMALTSDLVLGVVWLVIGAAAWVMALTLGYRRFWE